MKWYCVQKYLPASVGGEYIVRLLSGSVIIGFYDYQIDKGYFFSNEDLGEYTLNQVSHFAIIEPIELDQKPYFVAKQDDNFQPHLFNCQSRIILKSD